MMEKKTDIPKYVKKFRNGRNIHRLNIIFNLILMLTLIEAAKALLFSIFSSGTFQMIGLYLYNNSYWLITALAIVASSVQYLGSRLIDSSIEEYTGSSRMSLKGKAFRRVFNELRYYDPDTSGRIGKESNSSQDVFKNVEKETSPFSKNKL